MTSADRRFEPGSQLNNEKPKRKDRCIKSTPIRKPKNDRKVPAGFAERFADVNGVQLHYLIGGNGSPVVLLHGYAQTSHMWLQLMPLLAQRHTAIVPNLRDAGGSGRPESGYDKKNMAVDIHELTSSLGFDCVSIIKHDIGLMVAYAYAAQFPPATDRVVLMDAFCPVLATGRTSG